MADQRASIEGSFQYRNYGTYKTHMTIGIFKVNDFEDGGYYTDIYYHKLFKETPGSACIFAFHNSKKQLQYHTNVLCNHKNPLDALLTMGKTIRENKVTTVYTCQFICYLYLLLLRFIYPIKIVTKVDGLTTRRGHKKYTFLFYDLIYLFIIKFADYVFYETELAYKRLRETGRRKNAEVIYTPATNFYQRCLPKVDFQERKASDQLTVLFIGRYSEEKGYQLMGDIARSNPDCRFIMVGGYQKEYPEVSNIEELGRLEIDEIIEWYQKAHVVIVPSVCDAFPSVIREFAYFGKPIIATSVGAIHEFQKLGMEVIVVPPDSKSLSDAVSTISKKYHHSPINAAVYEKHFNPNNYDIVKKYQKAFCG